MKESKNKAVIPLNLLHAFVQDSNKKNPEEQGEHIWFRDQVVDIRSTSILPEE